MSKRTRHALRLMAGGSINCEYGIDQIWYARDHEQDERNKRRAASWAIRLRIRT
ncbi:MAG: hypothetical protein VW338_17180 [Rhodospirillaceae bacterium]